MSASSVIFGLAGPVLQPAEAAFFRDAAPWGFILFARNIENPKQVRRLTGDLRAAIGQDAPILIDQEGGRVARMGPPHWRAWRPALDTFDGTGEAAAVEAARLRYRIIADELRGVGIDVNCVPLLDMPIPEGHPAIGARALGTQADAVISRGRAVCEGLLAGGVLPVIKHMPGQGRATTDTHHLTARVKTDHATLSSTDFAPFRALADCPLGMTGHVTFEAIDPDACATFSPNVIRVIRDEIGFDGLLMTDDLSMQALDGTLGARAARAIAAGCDVALHCNGDAAEMAAVAASVPPLSGRAEARAKRAEAARRSPEPIDLDLAATRYAELTGEDRHV